MASKRTPGTSDSPVPGVIPETPRVQQDPPPPEREPVRPPTVSDPAVDREARRKAREARRGPRSERPAAMIPARERRMPLEAPVMRAVASAGIVGIAVVIAAIMDGQGAQGWLVGLVVSVASLVLAALLWSSDRL